MKRTKYNHGEAFCAMSYRCENGCKEVLWNSRDGVTPFTLRCVECGGVMEHVNWRDDVLILTVEDMRRIYPMVKRVFVTASPHDRHIIKSAKEYVDKYWVKDIGGERAAQKMTSLNRKSAVEYFVKEWTKNGAPTVISVEELLQRKG